ncbi:MAG: hypothetical protein D6701_07065, partial [Gemmatimonadetes bacterium]
MARPKRKQRSRDRRPDTGRAYPSTAEDARRTRLPGWVAPVLYGALTLVLFRAFVFSDQMLFGSDTRSLGYMARAFYAEALGNGTFPLWNPIILGGTPFLESLAGGDSLYPPSLALLLLTETYRALGWKLVLHVFLAGVFMHGWMRTLGASRGAALVAGVAYTLAPFMVTLVFPGQDGKIFVTALTPLLFWVSERFFVRRSAGSFAAVAAVVGLVILTTHFQMAYFLFGGAGLYAIFRAIQIARGTDDQPRRERATVVALAEAEPGEGGAAAGGPESAPAPALGPRAAGPRAGAAALGLFVAASVVGAGVAAVQLVPAADYVVEASRRTATTVRAPDEGGVEYGSSWSLHPEEVVALAVPEFVGSSVGGAAWTSGTYWGRNVFKLNHEYIGIVVLLLAGLAFFGGARPGVRWFLAGLGTLALLFALGRHTPVWRIFYEVVPGIRLFRAPSLAVFLTGFAAVTLMGLGLDRVLALRARAEDPAWARIFRYLFVACGLLGLGMLLAGSGVLTRAWTAVLYADLDPQKAEALARAHPFIARGFLFAFALAAASTAAVWLFHRARLGARGLLAALVVLVAVDLVRVDAPFIQTEDFHAWAQPDPAVSFLRERQAAEGPFRVLDMSGGGQEVRLGMFGLELAGGHHPNDLARYREVIGMVGSGLPVNLLTNPNVGRMLNVAYWVWPDHQYGPLDRAGLPEAVVSRLRPVTQTTSGGRPYQTVYAFDALPRAWLATRARVLGEADGLARVLDPAFDPEAEVVVDRDPGLALDGIPASGRVRWEERGLNRQRLTVESDRPALLVIAENWFPAWHATVDGGEAPVLRADHTLRAVPVPAGRHEVVLTYRSPLLASMLRVSVGSLALVVGLAVAGALRDRRRRGGAGEGAPEATAAGSEPPASASGAGAE